MNQTKIAIQGILGSFSSQAASYFFENKIKKGLANFNKKEIFLVECSSFLEVFESLNEEKSDFAAIPIENSIAGSIHENYDHLKNFKFVILDEFFLPIHHQLLTKNGLKLNQIEAVYSHPKAIEQCGKFLRKNNLKSIIFEDTAAAAKMVKESNENIAAIASIEAKEVCGLKFSEKNIEDVPNNFTRFLLIKKPDNGLDTSDKKDLQNSKKKLKTSITFQIKHEPGSLLKILETLNKFEANLTKIESRPIPEKEFEYQFHCDFVIENRLFLNQISKELKKLTKEIIFLGYYEI